VVEECQFCHIQEAPPAIEKDIVSKGYYIQKWNAAYNWIAVYFSCLFFRLSAALVHVWTKKLLPPVI